MANTMELERKAVKAPAKELRIGVLMPAGMYDGKDRVFTYTYKDPNKSLKSFTNIGDMFVYESSLRILEQAKIEPVHFERPEAATDEYIERLNSLDFIFLRGSNYINTSGQWDKAIALLERVKVPVMAFGVGVQVKDNTDVYMNPSTERFFKMIAERSKSIAVRGELSRKALASVGIKNVRIIGCPTVFRHRKPELTVARRPVEDIAKLGFTLRRKTFGNYTLQRYVMRTLAEQYDMTIMCAGELEEKHIDYANRKIINNPDEVRAAAVQALIDENWLYSEKDPILDLYNRALFVCESVVDFENKLKEMDAVTGFRLHGNLLALANGVPALYFTYDTRTREFVNTLGIPSIDVKTMDRFSFQKTWEEADFDKFEKSYKNCFGQLKAFLNENNMPHRLGE